MIKTPKRPRDLNQWAKRMDDIVTARRATMSRHLRNREKTQPKVRTARPGIGEETTGCSRP